MQPGPSRWRSRFRPRRHDGLRRALAEPVRAPRRRPRGRGRPALSPASATALRKASRCSGSPGAARCARRLAGDARARHIPSLWVARPRRPAHAQRWIRRLRIGNRLADAALLAPEPGCSSGTARCSGTPASGSRTWAVPVGARGSGTSALTAAPEGRRPSPEAPAIHLGRNRNVPLVLDANAPPV
jgi:hypothetical protein